MMLSRLALRGIGARSGTLSIVNYHRVFATQSALFPKELYAARFERQLLWLSQHFNVLPLRTANRLRLEGRLPPRALAITFDDGYTDNADVALPILKKTGLPATFFICSAWLGEGLMWNDKVIACVGRLKKRHLAALAELAPNTAELATLPESAELNGSAVISKVLLAFKYLPSAERGQRIEEFAALVELPEQPPQMMGPARIRKLTEAGMEVGGHTVSHPILANISQAEAEAEMTENKRWLEDIIQQPVTSFAYTNGRPHQDFTAESRQAVINSGFDLAVTTAKGVSTRQSDAFQLPRFTPWDDDEFRFVLRLLTNTYQTHPATV